MSYDLSLNIIVGGGEAQELKRCLESFVFDNDFFDEIVITHTTHDQDVIDVARQYTDKVFYFKWIKDFAAARNFCLDNTKSNYVFWIDSDDVLDKSSKENLLRVKEYVRIHAFDIFLISYHLDFDNEGRFLQHIPRDRIFKRRKMIWKYRVHEQLKLKTKNENTQPKVLIVKSAIIEHRPAKMPEVGLNRNLEILKEEYIKDPTNAHYAYYYARDLGLVGKFEQSLEIFDYIINNRIGNLDNLHQAAFQVATCFAYDKNNLIRKDTLDAAENYSRIAISFSQKYAEPYVLLGDIYYFKGQIEHAIRFYKIAMSKRLDAHGSQHVPFYEEIPSQRLSKIFSGMNTFTSGEEALYYNKLALKHNPKNEYLICNRKKLLEKME